MSQKCQDSAGTARQEFVPTTRKQAPHLILVDTTLLGRTPTAVTTVFVPLSAFDLIIPESIQSSFSGCGSKLPCYFTFRIW